MKKKLVTAMIATCTALVMLAGCAAPAAETGTGDAPAAETTTGGDEATDPANGGDDAVAEPPVVDTETPADLYQDADGNWRFQETRTISVGLWNRVADASAADTMWAEWIQENLLATHNIQVEFNEVPRWDQEEFQSTALSAGAASDIGYTFSAPMITTFANMGGIINLAPYIRAYEEKLPNLFEQVTPRNIFWNYDANTGELFNIAGRRASEGIQNTNTFIRQDWLDALGLPLPGSRQEFEDTLIAFRDRADELPGVGETVRIYGQELDDDGEPVVDDDGEPVMVVKTETTLTADLIIPYLVNPDSAWWALGLIESFIPDDITQREWYIHGFDDRRFGFEDAMREALRYLNRWFEEGLLWEGFVLAVNEDEGQDLIRLGQVGAFHSTWDQPYRTGDGWTRVMQENLGTDAVFVPVNPFENNAGNHVMYASGPVDRFVFMPTTNTEVLASLLYLDFMNRPETLDFLQFGIEGTHFEFTADGIRETLDMSELPPVQMMSGARNFDINPLMNGTWFDLVDQDAALATAALNYPGIEPEFIMNAFDIAFNYSRVFPNVITRVIAAEEGMSTPLADMRDQIMHRLIANTPSANFDAAFDAEYSVWLSMGGQAIADERAAAWQEFFGDADEAPTMELD